MSIVNFDILFNGEKKVSTVLCVLNTGMIEASSFQCFPGLITCPQLFLRFELFSDPLSSLLWPLLPVSSCTESLLDVFVGARWALVTCLGARTCVRLPDPDAALILSVSVCCF